MKEIRLAVAKNRAEEVRNYLKDFPLEESVEMVAENDAFKNSGTQLFLLVSSDKIISYPDWYNRSFPFLFPTLELSRGNLLGLLFYHLGLLEDALTVSKGAQIHKILVGLTSQENISWLEEWKSEAGYLHNLAVLGYYYQLEERREDVLNYFFKAVSNGFDIELQAYSLKHELVCRQEFGSEIDFLRIQQLLGTDLLEAAKNALQYESVKAKLTIAEQTQTAVSPREKEELQRLLSFYKQQNANLLQAELLNEMSWVASYEDHYSEALSYINQAIVLYRFEDQEVLCAELFSKKAGILHQWAKSGMPHFYQQAIQAYQETLKIVKQDAYPYWFAEIHNRLGVLYAEMPEEQQKRSIWAAVSATSFLEALSFFSKEEYPYEYASVCHNYATALINYPDAVRSDNIEKAIHYFNESLEIRTAETFPEERTVTLLNFLEASWEASNINELMENVRLKDMREKSQEVIALTSDPDLTQRAHEHLESIDNLEREVSNA